MLWKYMIEILYVHMFVCKDWGGGEVKEVRYATYFIFSNKLPSDYKYMKI